MTPCDPARGTLALAVLTKLLAAGLLIAFVFRVLMRTRVRGLGKRPRALIDIAIVVMGVAYVVQLVFLLTACSAPRTEARTTTPPQPQAGAPESAPEPTPEPTPEEPAPSCGDAEACMTLAVQLDASDPEAATEAYYGACLGGHVDGCEQAGLRWQKGVDSTADNPLHAKIMDAFERSCALGGLHGCGNVGLAYFYGTFGKPVDADKAVEYMTKSCEENKNKFVCRRLQQYRDGKVQPGVLPK